MHVVEVRGRADDVLARDDDVCAEGADGWVGPASEDAEPGSVCAFVRSRREVVRWAYGASGASGSSSHPRVGTRKTRSFKSSSLLSCAVTTIPDELCVVSSDVFLEMGSWGNTHWPRQRPACYQVRFPGTDPFESRAKHRKRRVNRDVPILQGEPPGSLHVPVIETSRVDLDEYLTRLEGRKGLFHDSPCRSCSCTMLTMTDKQYFGVCERSTVTFKLY